MESNSFEEITHWREIDFRYSWLSTTLAALKAGFDLIEKIDDEGSQIEEYEHLLGITFIALQTYISGVYTDLNEISQSNNKSRIKDKLKLYSDDNEPISEGLSRISLINSAANYYKHHDEWDVWGEGHSKGTVESLQKFGINENTDYPCCDTYSFLMGDDTNLEKLLHFVSDWRKYIMTTLK